MFKKSVITDEISQELDVAIELAKKYSLDGIEIRSVWEKGPHELEGEDINKLKSMILISDLEVSAISAPFFKCSLDNEEEISEHCKILDKCIAMADNLNTNIIRGFTFWDKGNFEDNINEIAARFEKPIEKLKEAGMILALESDPTVYATNAKKLVKVIEAIDSPYVKGLWDPGNDIYDPDGEIPYPNGYEIIKPHIVHVHLKDAKKQKNGKIVGTSIGTGDVDYKGQFKALIDSGYNGFVTLETHYRPTYEISEALMTLPKGSAFSYMGYKATEECLIEWNKILDISKNLLHQNRNY